MQKDKKIFERKLFLPFPEIYKEGNIVKDGVEDIFCISREYCQIQQN